MKASDQRKTKNSNNIYPNYLQNNQPKTNKLSFTNALRNNAQKQKLINGNNNKIFNNRNNNNEYQEKNFNNRKVYENNIYNEQQSKESNDEDVKEVEINNAIIKDQEININNIMINENIPKNKLLHNVDSFKNIEFLLPKKNNNIYLIIRYF